MATAGEMDLQPGNIVFLADRVKPFENGKADTGDAEITLSVSRVDAINVNTESFRGGTRLTKICPLGAYDLGQTVEVWSGYNGFIGEGDEGLRNLLSEHGLRIRVTIDSGNNPSFEFIKGDGNF